MSDQDRESCQREHRQCSWTVGNLVQTVQFNQFEPDFGFRSALSKMRLRNFDKVFELEKAKERTIPTLAQLNLQQARIAKAVEMLDKQDSWRGVPQLNNTLTYRYMLILILQDDHDSDNVNNEGGDDDDDASRPMPSEYV
ncbi:hypothetical protein JOM56_013421 [Amanita muscaria]